MIDDDGAHSDPGQRTGGSLVVPGCGRGERQRVGPARAGDEIQTLRVEHLTHGFACGVQRRRCPTHW